jgi:uncharacterized protein GlcG (DUF336 family)
MDFFNFIQGDPSLLAGIPPKYADRITRYFHETHVCTYGGVGRFPINVNGELVGAVGVSGSPTVQNAVDCARAALAHVSDGAR